MAKYPDLLAAQSDGLIHFWAMEETAGTTVADIIGGWNGQCIALGGLTPAEFDATAVVTPAGHGRDLSANWDGAYANRNRIAVIQLAQSAQDSKLSEITVRLRYFHRTKIWDTYSSMRSLSLLMLGRGFPQGVYLDVFGNDFDYLAGSQGATITDPMVEGQWYDFVIVGDSNSVDLYINGSLAASAPGASEFAIYDSTSTADSCLIGASDWDGGDPYLDQTVIDGIIQDVGIWNKKLSPAEISAMATEGVSEPLITNIAPITYEVELDFTLPITAEFAAMANPAEASLDFEFPIDVSVSGYQDWVAKLPPVEVQELYRLVITGSRNGLDDLVIGGISSWQATNQAGSRSAYLQAVIPAADQYMAAIAARQDGDLVIQKGYKLLSGETYFEEIMRAFFQDLQPAAGRYSRTLTVSGRRRWLPFSQGHRVLKAVRWKTTQNGKRRVFCEIDLFLQPGMTVDALGETFQADFINYYVNENDKFCEVGER